MPITLGNNISSLLAQRRLDDANSAFERTLERLASGQRINRASDDAAGLAISESLRAEARVYGRAALNVNDGISAINIAEGALSQLSSIVTRQLELAEQAANGVYSVTQRRSLHAEANSLVAEFNRIVASTTFNGNRLLDGTYDSLRIQAGFGLNGSLLVGVGSELEHNIGTGEFNALSSTTIGGQRDVRLSDFNNDGILDLAGVGLDNNIRVAMGVGDGTFGIAAIVGNAGNTNDMVLGDVNNDGLEDIILAASGGLGEVGVILANGAGTFAARVGYSVTGNAADDVRGLALGDLNGDGFLDIVSTSGGTSQTVEILLNNGNGTFADGYEFSSGGANPWSVTLADVNNDGHLDIGVGDATGSNNRVFLGSGNGTFGSGVSIGAGFSFEMELIDVNEDGFVDALWSQDAGQLQVALGRGNGTFNTAATYTTGMTNARDIELGDLNGDGILDVVMVAQGSNQAAILIGRGDGTFGSATVTASSPSARGLALGDVNGDGVLDIVSGGTTIGIQTGKYTEGSTIGRLYLLSAQGARESMNTIRQTLDRINLEVGALGSHRSRLSIALANVTAMRENFIAAESRIRDADIGMEAAELVRTKILKDAAAAILAQANQAPAIALTLLRAAE